MPDDEEINADGLDDIRPLHLHCHSLTTFELALVDLAQRGCRYGLGSQLRIDL